jgi:hypothetical protein
MYAAYETLSAPVREMIDRLYAEHSGYKTLPLLGLGYGERLQQNMRNVHPVVRVHPETGRKALFVNELWTEKIVGVSAFESQSILEMLWKHSQRLEFTMRWKWRVAAVPLCASTCLVCRWCRACANWPQQGWSPALLGATGRPTAARWGWPKVWARWSSRC